MPDNQSPFSEASDEWEGAGYVLASGARVLTPDGWREVEDLSGQTRIITRDAGAQRIARLDPVQGLAQKDLIAIKPGYFGATREVVLGQENTVLISHFALTFMFGEEEQLVGLGDLVGTRCDAGQGSVEGCRVIRMQLPGPHLIMVDGVWMGPSTKVGPALPRTLLEKEITESLAATSCFLRKERGAGVPEH